MNNKRTLAINQRTKGIGRRLSIGNDTRQQTERHIGTNNAQSRLIVNINGQTERKILLYHRIALNTHLHPPGRIGIQRINIPSLVLIWVIAVLERNNTIRDIRARFHDLLAILLYVIILFQKQIPISITCSYLNTKQNVIYICHSLLQGVRRLGKCILFHGLTTEIEHDRQRHQKQDRQRRPNHQTYAQRQIPSYRLC